MGFLLASGGSEFNRAPPPSLTFRSYVRKNAAPKVMTSQLETSRCDYHKDRPLVDPGTIHLHMGTYTSLMFIPILYRSCRQKKQRDS